MPRSSLPQPLAQTASGPPDRVDCSVTVTSVLGHLMELKFDDIHVKNWSGCTPEELFFTQTKKSVTQEHEPVKLNLHSEAQRADLLVIWTDCDREGENIGAEIVSVCLGANPRLLCKRARFSVIQQREIQQAMYRLVDLDMQQAIAVDVRSELDLRIGAALTRFLTLRFQNRFADLQNKMISYGSCQFPTLGFVVDAYRKVQNFVAEQFWKIQVVIEVPASVSGNPPIRCVFHWDRVHLFNEHICRILFDKCKRNPMARVMSVVSKPCSKWKPLPMTTIDLQRMGTRFLRMSSDHVMAVAEKLYQQGLISYPRTETNEFGASMDLQSLVGLQRNDPTWGQWVQHNLIEGSMYQRPRKGPKNDKAHPPIHPTKAAPVTGLSVDEKRIYDMITRRFLAACSTDAKGHETKVVVSVAGEDFNASGLVVLAHNYLEIYPFDKWTSSAELPNFSVGQEYMPSECKLVDGHTTPPSLLTETNLITLMDANGIGTDATIHEHIKKVVDRDYVIKQGEQGSQGQMYLYPSTLGIALVEGFDLITSQSLAKPFLRAAMERDLVAICQGLATPETVLTRIRTQFRKVYRCAVIHAYELEQRLVENLNMPVVDVVPHQALQPRTNLGQQSRPRPPRRNDNNGDENRYPPPPPNFGAAPPSARIPGFSNQTSTSYTPPVSHSHGGDESKRCLCDLTAVVMTVRKEGPNQGRCFYSCPNVSARCDFFEWAPEGVAPSSSSTRGGNRNARGRGGTRGGRGRGGRSTRARGRGQSS